MGAYQFQSNEMGTNAEEFQERSHWDAKGSKEPQPPTSLGKNTHPGIKSEWNKKGHFRKLTPLSAQEINPLSLSLATFMPLSPPKQYHTHTPLHSSISNPHGSRRIHYQPIQVGPTHCPPLDQTPHPCYPLLRNHFLHFL